MKYRLTLGIVSLLLLTVGCAHSPQIKTASSQDVTFTTLRTGNSSYTEYPSRLVLIQSQPAWDELWSKDIAGNVVPVPPSPQIDFQQHSVLAVFLGQRNTGGYSLDIGQIETNGASPADLVVDASGSSPAVTDIVTQALLSPVQVVEIDLTSLKDVTMILTDDTTGQIQTIQAERP